MTRNRRAAWFAGFLGVVGVSLTGACPHPAAPVVGPPPSAGPATPESRPTSQPTSVPTGPQAESQPTSRPAAFTPGEIEDPTGSLAPFFDGLRRAEAGRPDGRVAIVQLGDSHTQSDQWTGHVRHALQHRFGDAGRGFLLPGKPIKHYYQTDAAYGQSGKWTVEYGLRAKAEPPIGIGGVRVHADKPTATLWVGACAACPAGQLVGRFDVFTRKTPTGGKLAYRVDDGAWRTFDTRAVAGEPATASTVFDVPVPEGDHKLTLRPGGGGPVDLFGVVLERDRPGVVLDALGVVGAQLLHLHRWDWALIGEQLARRAPRLVVIQYGTNEVDNPDLDLGRFEQDYVDVIERVKQAAPGASILVLGPPDMGARERKDCDPKKPKVKGKPKAAKGKGQGKTGAKAPPAPPIPPPTSAPVAPGCEWKTPAKLHDVIDAERRAARHEGVAFYDQFAAMGGRDDRMDELFHEDPPRAYRDHVHLTQRGYDWLADAFLADLLTRYTTWLATALPMDPPSPPVIPPAP